MRTLLAVVLLCAVAGTVDAGKKFYKWQDENGVWQYSEKAPKGQVANQVNVNTSAPDLGDPVADTAASTASTTAKSPPANSSDPAADRVIANRQDACERAQKAVTVYEENGEVQADLDGDGAAELLNAEQHLQQLARAREQAEAFCN